MTTKTTDLPTLNNEDDKDVMTDTKEEEIEKAPITNDNDDDNDDEAVVTKLPSSSSADSNNNDDDNKTSASLTSIFQNDNAFFCLQILNGTLVIVAKWFVSVLLRKLIDASYQSDDVVAAIKPTNGLLEFVFLYGVSFETAAILCLVAFFSGSFTASLLGAASYKRATTRGQELRHDIVTKVEKSSAEGTNITRVANDLLIQVKVIEDFVAREEKWIMSNVTVIFLSLILTTIFLWYGGLIAIGCIVFADMAKFLINSARKKHEDAIFQNEEQVNARLLDVVKNGVKIKMMNQTQHELQQLEKLEHQTHHHREADVQWMLLRDFLKHAILTAVPVGMSWITYAIIQSVEQEKAVDLGSAVLAAIVLLDECQNNLIMLHFTSDKQAGAQQAQAKIDAFLHNNEIDNNETTTTTDNEKDEPKEEEKTATIGASPDNHSNVNKGATAAAALSTITDLESNDMGASIEITKTVPKPLPAFQQVCHDADYPTLSFTNVTWTYPGRDAPALDNYSQDFARGKTHALVGESGSGKSTMLKMIASLLTPQSGCMTYWKGMKVAYVNQDQKIFARTIRENVTYGACHNNDKDIWEALRMANIADWVETLPNGLDEELVRGEQDISGGQLQRLNLAHLFCACQDADLVVLDEVLSALDQASREYMIDQLGTFLQNKTAIIITHHSEMLRICDEVHQLTPAVVDQSTRISMRDTSSQNQSSNNARASTVWGTMSMRSIVQESMRSIHCD